MKYNIYYGTVGTVTYRFTKFCKNDKSAKDLAKKSATSFYYKNEGKHGIPTFDQIIKENQITGINEEKLYNEHINDLMRWYAIPTDLDTVSSKNIKY